MPHSTSLLDTGIFDWIIDQSSTENPLPSKKRLILKSLTIPNEMNSYGHEYSVMEVCLVHLRKGGGSTVKERSPGVLALPPQLLATRDRVREGKEKGGEKSSERASSTIYSRPLVYTGDLFHNHPPTCR